LALYPDQLVGRERAARKDLAETAPHTELSETELISCWVNYDGFADDESGKDCFWKE
jgi:hypothetical protein